MPLIHLNCFVITCMLSTLFFSSVSTIHVKLLEENKGKLVHEIAYTRVENENLYVGYQAFRLYIFAQPRPRTETIDHDLLLFLCVIAKRYFIASPVGATDYSHLLTVKSGKKNIKKSAHIHDLASHALGSSKIRKDTFSDVSHFNECIDTPYL